MLSSSRSTLDPVVETSESVMVVLEAAGAWDPVAALVLCGPLPVRDLIVEGRKVVSGGRLCTVEPERLAAEAGAAVARLMA